MKFKLPELGENIASGDVTNVPVKVGDTVKKNQTLLELEAGKASMEIPSPADGVLKALHVKVGDTVKAGQLVAEIEGASPKLGTGSEPQAREARQMPGSEAANLKPETKPEPKPEPNPEPKPEPVVENPKSAIPNPQYKAVSAAPNVRKLARELGVNIHEVPASAPDGHVSEEDVKAYARGAMQNGRAPAVKSGEPSVRVEKMSPTRKATMNHMAHCWATIPHVTQHDVADITKLEELRKRYAPRAEAAGAKLTMTAILIKVIASALKIHPKFNCMIDPEKEEIRYKNFYNIGVAMDTPKGLLVPVIRDGGKKNIVELALELQALTVKAREGKITADDMKGGTFTFTNLGIIGGSFFTPIINSPEVAILGSGRACWEAGVHDTAKRLRLPLSLSYDHRIIDGADGACFLKWIVEAVEEPMLLSLEG
jgi:pyruvate dehydrogenase E2 component (dihydrolipoamide acetyltransferase)